jgi:hypothetical protein
MPRLLKAVLCESSRLTIREVEPSQIRRMPAEFLEQAVLHAVMEA